MSDLFDFPYEKRTSKYWKNAIQYHLNGKSFLELNSVKNIEQPVKPFYDAENDFSVLDTTEQKKETTPTLRVVIHQTNKALSFIKELSEKLPVDFLLIFYKPINNLEDFFNQLPKNNRYFLTFDKLSWEEITTIIKISSSFQMVIPCLDPIHQLTKTGNFYENFTKDLSYLDKYSLPYFIDASQYTNGGASTVQQIAYTITHLNEYLEKRKSKPTKIIIKISFNNAFFTELAKKKAIYFLIKKSVERLNHSVEIITIAESTNRNKWSYRWNQNKKNIVIENTIAFCANMDNLLLKHPEEIVAKPQKKHIFEAFHLFEKSKNKGLEELTNGSFFYETLSIQLVQQATEIINELIQNKGLISQLIKGNIQNKIEKNALKESDFLTENMNEKELVKIKKSITLRQKPTNRYPFLKFQVKKTLIKPIKSTRLYESIEKKYYNNFIGND